VMVGTPGRVLDHLQRGTLHLGKVRFLVLDEADRMLDMGFIDDVMKITSHMPKERQTLLFSATIPDEIRNVINRHLREPVYVKTESYVDKSHLRQVFYPLRQEDKFSLLVHLLKTESRGFALVFCATRRRVDALTRNLIMQGVEAIGIHGGMVQNKRLKALDKLKRSTIHVLVATDVAARGLDIRNITHIYNFDVPKTSDEYIHRIGRTARAGAEGDAITFVSPMDQENFRAVLSDRSLEIKQENLPDHERLPYKAKGGGNNRRGRPEGVSRTGKSKSDFSNTHPRAHPHNAGRGAAGHGRDQPEKKVFSAVEHGESQHEKREFSAAEHSESHQEHQGQQEHYGAQPHQRPQEHQPPKEHEHMAARAKPAESQRQTPVDAVAYHKSAAGQEERRGSHPYTTGRMNRKQRRHAHRNNQQRG
jgi:superfamily II DNA/RNA helicase